VKVSLAYGTVLQFAFFLFIFSMGNSTRDSYLFWEGKQMVPQCHQREHAMPQINDYNLRLHYRSEHKGRAMAKLNLTGMD